MYVLISDWMMVMSYDYDIEDQIEGASNDEGEYLFVKYMIGVFFLVSYRGYSCKQIVLTSADVCE